MKTNPALKTLAFLVCAVSAAATFWAGLFTLRYWDDIWTEPDYFRSADYASECYAMRDRVESLLELEEQAGALTYTQQQQLSALQNALDPAGTNFRYELRLEETGELLMSNLGSALLDDVAGGIQTGVFLLSSGAELHDRDKIYWEAPNGERINTAGGYYELGDFSPVLEVWTGTEYLRFDAGAGHYGYNDYGWYWGADGWDSYSANRDCRVTQTAYALRAGALEDLPVHDGFYTGMLNYLDWHSRLPTVGAAALAGLTVFFLTALYLFCSAGHRSGAEGISPGWQEKIPLDVYAVAAFFIAALACSMADSIAWGLELGIRAYRIAGLLAVSAAVAAPILGFLLTAAVRIKARVFWQSFLSLRLCAWCWNNLMKGVFTVGRGVKNMFRTLSMNVRLGIAFLVYLAINAALAAGLFLTYSTIFYLTGLVLFNGGVFWLACRWIDQWQYIRENTGRIVGGDSGVQIDTTRMYPDLRRHAEQLNDLGTAIDHAVDERLKSEHFKAELITNVSHDLKTPLTSIINYVDLLKKLDIDDPKAREYLEVLDRKGQRLKKLTEDLVEASKASTGNVAVNPVRMDLVEFTQQAAAEYEDRLSTQGLTLVSRMSEQPIYISADGRHMWRILDNLLGNCAKYAMEGTRVYLEVSEREGKAGISIKNISRDPLTADPESLTERFIRGDESRTTDGSGLGLSIARSLTEVQGGVFRLDTDGDLFKATVCFPVVLALEASHLGERV